MLVFSQSRRELPEKRRRHLLLQRRENQYHAILGGGPSFIVHPSNLAPALIALRASATIVGPAGASIVALENSSRCRRSIRRENSLKPGEIITE